MDGLGRIDEVEERLGIRIDEIQMDIKMLDNRQTELYEVVSTVHDNQLYQRAELDLIVHTLANM